MPKMKTHSGAKKRFKLTKTGKVKKARANGAHLLNEKSSKRKSKLRKSNTADKTNVAAVRRLLPNG